MKTPEYTYTTNELLVKECSWQATQDGPQTFKIFGNSPPAGHVLYLKVSDHHIMEISTKPTFVEDISLQEELEEFLNIIIAQKGPFLYVELVSRMVDSVIKHWDMWKYSSDVHFISNLGRNENVYPSCPLEEGADTDELKLELQDGDHPWHLLVKQFKAALRKLDTLVEECMDAVINGPKDGCDQEDDEKESKSVADDPSEETLRLLQLGQSLRDKLAQLEDDCKPEFETTDKMPQESVPDEATQKLIDGLAKFEMEEEEIKKRDIPDVKNDSSRSN